MAKSTRSKVKRAYRAKKREDGVYAASEAARLKRLSSKLKGVAEEDAKEIVGLGIEEAETSVPGSFWFHLLGIMDPRKVNPESMHNLQSLLGSPVEEIFQC